MNRPQIRLVEACSSTDLEQQINDLVTDGYHLVDVKYQYWYDKNEGEAYRFLAILRA